MKAISIKQPFAGLIATGKKRLEIRSWETDYRGPLLICASLNIHEKMDSYHFKSELLKLDNKSSVSEVKINRAFLRQGVALCVVDLVGVGPFFAGTKASIDACIDWIPSQKAWELENVRLIEPFSVKGKLRLFEVDDSLIKFL